MEITKSCCKQNDLLQAATAQPSFEISFPINLFILSTLNFY